MFWSQTWLSCTMSLRELKMAIASQKMAEQKRSPILRPMWMRMVSFLRKVWKEHFCCCTWCYNWCFTLVVPVVVPFGPDVVPVAGTAVPDVGPDVVPVVVLDVVPFVVPNVLPVRPDAVPVVVPFVVPVVVLVVPDVLPVVHDVVPVVTLYYRVMLVWPITTYQPWVSSRNTTRPQANLGNILRS